MENKKNILIQLEVRPRTVSCANKLIKKTFITPPRLNKYWLGDKEPMGTKKYFFSEKCEEEFKKFIISNRDYSLEIKNNLKNKNKKSKLKKDEKLRKCTRCKKEFITKVDKLGISYDTRCKDCKSLERKDKTGRLNGRLGKIELGG